MSGQPITAAERKAVAGRTCYAKAVALTGLDPHLVTAETAVSQQLPGMVIIGLPDTSLAEAKQRVKVAASQVGAPLSNRFLTVNLSPAALPKQGSGFDLAIAVSCLAASGHIPAESTKNTVYIGELGLDGTLRRPRGLLAMVRGAAQLGYDRVIVPATAAVEARLVSHITVIPLRTLRDVIEHHQGAPTEPPKRFSSVCVAEAEPDRRDTKPQLRQHPQCDFTDIVGQHEAIEALTIAAAGGHNLAMVGPPGAGKTMLAERLPTILPELTEELALEATSIASLHSEEITELQSEPPFEAPHHTASAAAVIGGGTNRVIHIGAITRANNGVLFLDEAPEFSSRVLEALRQPLESGTVEIHRTQLHAKLPARFQLILAANPCPCGNAGNTAAAQTCTCTPYQRIRYSGKISGPLKDRIDMHLQLQRVSHASDHAAAATTSSELRSRVIAARVRARNRLKNTPWET